MMGYFTLAIALLLLVSDDFSERDFTLITLHHLIYYATFANLH